MDPRERLSAGQLAALEGRYEEALDEYVWFHDHALEYQRSLYGVRLSFALAYWMDLAELYPRARARLEEIRDQKASSLAAGKGDRLLFHDVEAINQSLGEEAETYHLFVKMLDTAPFLAASCADDAIEAIVKARDFPLAERYSDLPEDALLRYSDSLNEHVAGLSGDAKRRARVLDAYIHIYCDRVGTTIAILEGIGKSDDAGSCRDWAVALVDSKPVRKRVEKILLERYDA